MLKIPTGAPLPRGEPFHVVAAEQLSVLGQAWSANSRPLHTGHDAQTWEALAVRP